MNATISVIFFSTFWTSASNRSTGSQSETVLERATFYDGGNKIKKNRGEKRQKLRSEGYFQGDRESMLRLFNLQLQRQRCRST
jgi:hypothetical protein